MFITCLRHHFTIIFFAFFLAIQVDCECECVCVCVRVHILNCIASHRISVRVRAWMWVWVWVWLLWTSLCYITALCVSACLYASDWLRIGRIVRKQESNLFCVCVYAMWWWRRRRQRQLQQQQPQRQRRHRRCYSLIIQSNSMDFTINVSIYTLSDCACNHPIYTHGWQQQQRSEKFKIQMKK